MPNVMVAQPNRWFPLLNAVDQLAKIFAPGKIPLGGKRPRKCIRRPSVTTQETAKHRAVWLTSVERCGCSDEAKSSQPFSADSGPKLTIL